MKRFLRSGAGMGAMGLVLATLGLWANLEVGLGKQFAGQGWPQTPSLPVTHGSLLLESLRAAIPVALVTGLAGLLRRELACAGFVLGWLYAGMTLGMLFAPAFGTTFTEIEALTEVFWVRGLTITIPLAGAAVLWFVTDPDLF